jgi:hypothetical protein
MRVEELSESFGIATLAALDQARGIHLPDFNSDRRVLLVLGRKKPHDWRGRRIRQRWTELEGGSQPKVWCTAPVAFSDPSSEK